MSGLESHLLCETHREQVTKTTQQKKNDDWQEQKQRTIQIAGKDRWALDESYLDVRYKDVEVRHSGAFVQVKTWREDVDQHKYYEMVA
ncbi:MAG: hypothetical protein Q9228_004430 [Teloschistes exilis]